MTIMLIYRTYIWGLHQVQEIYRILAKNSRAKKQESTMKPAPGKCSREKIFDHFIKHFNTTRLVDSGALKELSGNLPEFVRELQNISNSLPINHLMRFRNIFINENQGKLVTMLILSYWKNVNTHLCFKLLIEWLTNYGQTCIFLLFRVILDWKLSGREKGQCRILVSIEDLALHQQCASWSLISP